ncbi:hypothetical protein D3C85_1622810 [compost metagenome]
MAQHRTDGEYGEEQKRNHSENINRNEQPFIAAAEPVELEQTYRRGQNEARPHRTPAVEQRSQLAHQSHREQDSARDKQAHASAARHGEVQPVHQQAKRNNEQGGPEVFKNSSRSH